MDLKAIITAVAAGSAFIACKLFDASQKECIIQHQLANQPSSTGGDHVILSAELERQLSVSAEAAQTPYEDDLAELIPSGGNSVRFKGSAYLEASEAAQNLRTFPLNDMDSSTSSYHSGESRSPPQVSENEDTARSYSMPSLRRSFDDLISVDSRNLPSNSGGVNYPFTSATSNNEEEPKEQTAAPGARRMFSASSGGYGYDGVESSDLIQAAAKQVAGYPMKSLDTGSYNLVQTESSGLVYIPLEKGESSNELKKTGQRGGSNSNKGYLDIANLRTKFAVKELKSLHGGKIEFIGRRLQDPKAQTMIGLSWVRIREALERTVATLLEFGPDMDIFRDYFGKKGSSYRYNYENAILHYFELLRLDHLIMVSYNATGNDLPPNVFSGNSILCENYNCLLVMIESRALKQLNNNTLDEYLATTMFAGLTQGISPLTKPVLTRDAIIASSIKDKWLYDVNDDGIRDRTALSHNPAAHAYLMKDIDAMVRARPAVKEPRTTFRFREFFYSKAVRQLECERVGIDPRQIDHVSYYSRYSQMIYRYGINQARQFLQRMTPAELIYFSRFCMKTEMNGTLDFMVNMASLTLPTVVRFDLEKMGLTQVYNVSSFNFKNYIRDLSLMKVHNRTAGMPNLLSQYFARTDPVRLRMDLDGLEESGFNKFEKLRPLNAALRRHMFLLPMDRVSTILKSIMAGVHVGTLHGFKEFFCVGFVDRTCKKFITIVSDVFKVVYQLLKDSDWLDEEDKEYKQIFSFSEYGRVNRQLQTMASMESLMIAAMPRTWTSYMGFKKQDPYVDSKSDLIMLPRKWSWMFATTTSLREHILEQLVTLISDNPGYKYETARDLGVLKEDPMSTAVFNAKMVRFLKRKVSMTSKNWSFSKLFGY